MDNKQISGIVNVLKPPGMTSFDVVGFLRGVLRIKKIGHTGTLDPAAVGVLPVCIGQATKAIEYMMDKDKVYRAELTLGSSTDTQDSTGEVLEIRPVEATKEQIMDVCASFVGTYRQVPPMYSAVKIGGKKLYELAREGKTVEREAREVQIYSIQIIDLQEENSYISKVVLDVHCSKGTYIRTLCADIGDKLGCGGHMSFLVRLRAGAFDLDSALTLEEIERYHKDNSLQRRLLSVEKVFSDFDELVLAEDEMKKFLNGVWIEPKKKNSEKGLVRVLDDKGNFFALGEIFDNKSTFMLKSKKLFTL